MFFCAVHCDIFKRHKPTKYTVVCFTCIGVSSHTDACKTYHTAHTPVSLRMNPRGSKHVGDKKN